MQHNIATNRVYIEYDAGLNFADGIKIYDFSWAIKGLQQRNTPLFACRVTPRSRQVSYLELTCLSGSERPRPEVRR